MDNGTEKQRGFFDKLAPTWRDGFELSDADLERVLRPVPLDKFSCVLDVACGAGVLDGYLLKKGLKVDAIDLSPLMIERAVTDPEHKGVNYFVADFYEFSGTYDALLVFDSFPHFTDRERFARSAWSLLADEGELWIFFDDGREHINAHHVGMDADLSSDLLSPEQEYDAFKDMFEPLFFADGERGYYLGLKKRRV